MINFDKWKKLNESYFGILGGALGGPVTPPAIGTPIVQGNIDTNGFRTLGDSFKDDNPPKFMEEDEEIEDENDEDGEEDEIEEVDMEDAEDMEDEDMEDEDMEDEDMEDEDMEDEDMEDEVDMKDEKENMKDDGMYHHHHMHHHHHMQEEGHKMSKKSKKYMKKDNKEKCGYMKKDEDKKCGSYMSENTSSFSSIPTLEEWQKSVASMYDPKFFDKKFDGITILNEDIQVSGTIMSALNNLDKKLGTKSTPYYMEVIEEIFKKLMPKLTKNHVSNFKTKIRNMLSEIEKAEAHMSDEK